MGVVRALASALRRPLLSCLLVALPTLASAQAGTLVLGIGAFTTKTDNTTDSSEFAGNGLADSLHTDIMQLLDTDGEFSWCPGKLAEVRRRQVVIDELEFEQTKYVDKSTAIKREDWNLLVPDLLIGGTVIVEGGQMIWNVHMRETADGPDMLTYEGKDSHADLTEVSRKLAHDILADHCPAGYNVTGGGPRIKIAGQIVRLDMQFELLGQFPGGTAAFIYTPTSRKGGTVQYTLSGGGVSGGGSGTYTLADGDEGIVLLSQETIGCISGIPNSCKDNHETMTLTPMYPK